MIFNRIWSNKKSTVDINRLIQEVEHVKKHGDYIVLVPGTTGYNWMGVNRSTKDTFPGNFIELPQYYSSSQLSDQQLQHLLNTIKSMQFDQVILSGFPPYFESIALQLNSWGIKVKVLYHGFFSELANNEKANSTLKKMLELSSKGIIYAVGFNKKGMAETMKELWGINAHKYSLYTPLREFRNNRTEHTRIGVLGNDQFRKNLHNQIAAAALIDNAEIHVTTEQEFSYLPSRINIVRHKTGMEHQEFLDILGSVDVNLHLSYSESWGLLTTESLSMGVPCLVSYHSDIFDYDQELYSLLVVEDYDNNLAINERIIRILNTDGISERCRDYVLKLNQLSRESIDRFMNE